VDEDTETEDHEENGKCGVLADEDGYKSSHVFPDQEENPVQTSDDCILLQDPLTLHIQSSSPSASIADFCQAGLLGPVSPPVLGEDLSKRGLCFVKLPSNKEDDSSEKKANGFKFRSDTKCLSSSHSSEHNLHVSESCSSPLFTISHSEQHKKSVKPELFSASIIESDANSSSLHPKEYDKPKTQASLPTFTIEDDADISDGDTASPSLLTHLNTSELDSSVENSDSSGTIIMQPTNVNMNGEKSKSESNSDFTVHTTLTKNEFVSSKFVVTKMEVKSDRF
jgi:hypothetical protein